MKFVIIIIVIIIILVLVTYIVYIRRNTAYVKAEFDGKYYLVRKLKDKDNAANILAKIRYNILQIGRFAIDKYTIPPYSQYMNTLNTKIQNITITENIYNMEYTSYSVDKGAELVFCLRSKLNNNNIHDFNLLMYVVIHELAHIACPEYGHTELFKNIFINLLTIAIDNKLYIKSNYNINPVEYCGIMISESII